MERYFPVPKGMSAPAAKKRVPPESFDFTVGPSGFETIVEARDAARKKRAGGYAGRINVRVSSGEYRVSGLSFDRRDSDTTYYADGEAILNGGFVVPGEAFRPVEGEAALRLDPAARDKIYCADLKKYGLTGEDWGKVYAVGSYNTASKYDGDTIGVTCEVFCGDRRMVMARYPNGNGFLKIDAVLDMGDIGELPPQNYFPEFADIRNPRGGTVIMTKADAERCAKWKTTEDVWALGYFYHDWAESSTPVKSIDPKHRLLTFGYASGYAYRIGAPFCFYNVFEELDEPGEYYLDRASGLLYVYPYGDIRDERIEISLSKNKIIRAEGVSGMVFDGFTVKCARADGIYISGSDNLVENCLVTNVFGNAAVVKGERNTVRGCEITHTGRGGIMLEGGDRLTLTHGENIAENNLIHDWSEVYLAYQPAVMLNGCGNTASHNEIYNSPQMAICYGGNEHLIEYNLIHDVVKQSSDAGAIYSGMSWTAHGTVIRYNCLYNIGAGDFMPCGIYWDDALSGQTAYGNALINVANLAFLVGGGRDNSVRGNLIINAGGCGIHYDDRARDAVVNDGWAREAYKNPHGRGWMSLDGIPLGKGVWAEKYPTLNILLRDFYDPDDPEFPPNPTHSVVSGNAVVDKKSSVGNIADSVFRYGEVKDNFVCGLDDDIGFVDEKNGDYRLRPDAALLKALPDFKEIPFDKIGRQ